MDRGDRNLLHDLDLFGRIAALRPTVRARLESELGAATFRQLVPAVTRSNGSTPYRSRRVA